MQEKETDGLSLEELQVCVSRTTDDHAGSQQSNFSKVPACRGIWIYWDACFRLMYNLFDVGYRHCLQRDAVLEFMEQTNVTTGSVRIDALCLIITMTPILRLPNYESEAKI